MYFTYVYTRCSLLNLKHSWSEVNTQIFSLFLLVTLSSFSYKEIEIHPLKMPESGAIWETDSPDEPWNAKFQPTEFFFPSPILNPRKQAFMVDLLRQLSVNCKSTDCTTMPWGARNCSWKSSMFSHAKWSVRSLLVQPWVFHIMAPGRAAHLTQRCDHGQCSYIHPVVDGHRIGITINSISAKWYT